MVLIIVATDKEFERKIEQLQEQAIDMANDSIESQKQFVESYNKLILEYGDVLEDYMSYITSDIIDSYNKLIQLRKETIDKYIGLYTKLFKKDAEFDISKPMKSLLEKQQEDIVKWQKEIEPILELTKCDEKTSDERANEIMDMLRNI